MRRNRKQILIDSFIYAERALKWVKQAVDAVGIDLEKIIQVLPQVVKEHYKKKSNPWLELNRAGIYTTDDIKRLLSEVLRREKEKVE